MSNAPRTERKKGERGDLMIYIIMVTLRSNTQKVCWRSKKETLTHKVKMPRFPIFGSILFYPDQGYQPNVSMHLFFSLIFLFNLVDFFLSLLFIKNLNALILKREFSFIIGC